MREERFPYPTVRPEQWVEVMFWTLRVAVCLKNEDATTSFGTFVGLSGVRWIVREYAFIRHLIEDADDWMPHIVITHWHGHPESIAIRWSERSGSLSSTTKQIHVKIGHDRVDPYDAPLRFAEQLRERGDDIRTRPFFVATHYGDEKMKSIQDPNSFAGRARKSYDLLIHAENLFEFIPAIGYSVWQLLGGEQVAYGVPSEQIEMWTKRSDRT